MVDNSGEYVLQWEGHARHVTERFSGLFARQSLVDVTLICEEQRIRVHKLVLASCSPYFEEMLEQDLGQEPTILLSDLNFEVLKAMVEFMYCGETSVSEQHLEPLLHAARVFKVKELACIAANMIGAQNVAVDQVRNFIEVPKEDADDLEDGNEYSLFSDNDCAQTQTLNKIGMNESSGSEVGQSFNTNVENTENFPQYEAPLSLAEIAYRNVVKFYREIPSAVKLYLKKMNSANETIEDDNVFSNDKNELEPVIYEQCCDFVNTETNMNEYVMNNLQTPQSRQQEKPLPEFKEVTRTVDKCLKVYTHKRRKSFEGVEKQSVKIVDDLPELPVVGNCIDLIDEPSKNETELENDYILSLSSENVGTVIDFASNEPPQDNLYYAVTPTNLNKKSRQMREIFSNDNRMISNQQSDTVISKSNSLCTPTLRRSVRLSHQENEDSTNNNNSIDDMDKIKDFRKESLKRKNRESDSYCELHENEELRNTINTKCLDPPRSLRSNSSKLIERRGGKARLSLSKSNGGEEQKPRANNKTFNSESHESFAKKFNTIATVSRALWGDMSDCLENTENNIDSSDYSPSKEIPFAVGLLPLRAALERMQAMPDYQPRKTRSSVTPFRQEFKGVKSKNFSGNIVDSNNCNVKRQSSNSHSNNLTGNTVCHVRITTSHSQPVRSRRRIITEQVDAATTSPTNNVNRQ